MKNKNRNKKNKNKSVREDNTITKYFRPPKKEKKEIPV